MKEFLSYNKAKQAVQEFNDIDKFGVGNSLDYKFEYSNIHPNLPANPHAYYKEWTNWHDFLGKL
jgi:hypothetical protein